MKKQKICIIGDGLTGLTTAIAINNLDADVHLYYDKKKTNIVKDKRITAISNSNLEFLRKLIEVKKDSTFWPCESINLYYEKKTGIINFLNFEKNSKYFMHIFQNYLLKNLLLKKLKKNKVKMMCKKVDNINHSNTSIKVNNKTIFYDLIILCLGNRSDLYENLIGNRMINKNYNQTAVTGQVKHNIKLDNPSQYFLKEGPLAFLPFNKKNFSYVWSLDNRYYNKNKNDLKNIIKEKIAKLLKSKKFSLSQVQSFPLHLRIKKKYYKNNTLILGEGIHSIHPIAGQGFNLIIRDIKELYNAIKKNISLGLDVKDSLILKEFYSRRRSENTIIGMGVDLTNTFFKKNDYFDPLKDFIMNNVSKSKIINRISKNIADRGFFNN